MGRASKISLLTLVSSYAVFMQLKPAPQRLVQGEKKSKFLAAYPMVWVLGHNEVHSLHQTNPQVFKFLLFWWCVFVFAAGPSDCWRQIPQQPWLRS